MNEYYEEDDGGWFSDNEEFEDIVWYECIDP